MNRPKTTLFMLMSVDGKISTGDTDVMDFDRDLKRITGVKEGLQQYYDLEKQTDLFSLNTGKVMAKIGVNTRTEKPPRIPCSFVIIDNQPHLTAQGVTYLSEWVKTLYVVTTNSEHPANKTNHENVVVLPYKGEINFEDLFFRLKNDFGATAITIQSGGTLNAMLMRKGLIDELSVVVAPVVVGGKITPSLIDGESLHEQAELRFVKALTLLSCNVIRDSYLHLRYEVIKETILE